ncbi:MAG: S8 family serine peptidase [Deltaproteobacteria bacterium]|nr:S8 family serine peptidase [Deltaproteobacteria bacterium]
MSSGKGGKWLVILGWVVFSLAMVGAPHRAQAESSDRHTFKPPKSLEASHVPNEVLVKFKNSPTTFRGKPSREHLHSVQGAAATEFAAALPSKAQEALARVQGQVARAHPSIGLTRVKLPPQVSVAQAIETLYRSGAVEYAEPNGLIKLQGTPGDPLFASQWALPQIKAPEAWDIVYPGNVVPTGGKNTIVAVVDTGVDYLHEDFYVTVDNPSVHRYTLPSVLPPLYFPGDPLTSNLWVNHGEEVDDPYNPTGPKIFIQNSIDDDANNFVDDYFGINTSVTPSTGDPMDPAPSNGGHGTAMAGIIGAVGNNGIGMTGVNWQTRIMALRFANAGGGTVDNAITCINYALAKRGTAPNGKPTPLVITLGWKQAQNTYYNSLHDSLRIAQDQGALVVAAAGNDGEDNDIFPNYPSSYNHDIKDFPVVSNITADNVISVGGSDQFDKRETNSSYGIATVDLFAPGKDIVCTVTPPATPAPPPIHTTFGSGTGTSYATAYVAGACALLWDRYPDKDWKQIKGLILNGTEDGAAQDFRAICVTEGRLNLANSLDPAIENAPAVFSIFEVTPATGDPAIVPGRADTGDLLVITGVNFGTGSTGSTISFLGTTFPTASIVSWDNEKIVATVPAGLPKGTGRLLVTSAAGLTSRGACFSNISRERQVPSLILARGLAAGAQVGRNVWIIGGRTYWGIVGHVEMYSLDTYRAVSDSNWMMPTPVSNAGAASIGTKIYVVGGATEDPTTTNAIPVANLQIFDTTTRTWETNPLLTPPLPKALMQCAVTSIGSNLYAFGGLKLTGTSTYTAVTDAYVYDTVAHAWSSLAVLPTAVAYAAATPNGSGKIWVMGGSSTSLQGSQLRTVQEYDPSKNLWTPQLHLVRPRGGAAGINFAGKVYCLRGSKGYQNTNFDEYADGEWYNPDPAWGYWMPSIMNYLGIYPTLPSPPSGFNRLGLYSPTPGKYVDKIYLLGGVLGTANNPYKFDYSNKVWAFPAPSGGMEYVGNKGVPAVSLLLLDE